MEGFERRGKGFKALERLGRLGGVGKAWEGLDRV